MTSKNIRVLPPQKSSHWIVSGLWAWDHYPNTEIWQVKTQQAWTKAYCCSVVRYEGFKYYQTLTNPLKLGQCVFLCVYFIFLLWWILDLLGAIIFLPIPPPFLPFPLSSLTLSIFSRLCVLNESHPVTKEDSSFCTHRNSTVMGDLS